MLFTVVTELSYTTAEKPRRPFATDGSTVHYVCFEAASTLVSFAKPSYPRERPEDARAIAPAPNGVSAQTKNHPAAGVLAAGRCL